MVRIFTTPHCGRCKAAKDFFRRRVITFEEVNVENDFGALRTMIRLSGARTVPVIQVGDEIVIGFEPDLLEKALVGKEK